MQIEPMPTEDGYRCWLSSEEQEQIVDFWSEEPDRKLAIELMLDGFRGEETTRVARQDFRQLDAETEAFKVRIREGKTGYRECPVSSQTRLNAVTMSKTKGLRQGEPIIDVHPRTVRRWVKTAAEALAKETGDDDWRHVRPHDLRRTWATHTFFRLDAHYAADVIMRWGGWSDRGTFESNYLGREPDDLAAEMMDRAGLL
ncbi:tyrosine-type recombinase/integrase [Halomarina salina]|uniref:Tyrosine-type recombinase/integrase n=2 Tax=Halomarina salina TaxID=1872699 RepID=A0ABD5RPS7_9EURY